jgi:WD40 repeat protein
VPAAWTLVRRIRLGDFFATDAAFSPDGRTIALAGWARGGSVALWDVRRGRLTALLPGNAPATQTVAFDASGQFLVSAGIDGRICVWDLRGGRLHVVIQEEASLLRQARFPLVVGGRGRWIAYGRTDGRVALADLRTGRRIAVRSLGAREVFDLAVSRDGRWLAAATDLGIRLWDTHAPTADARLLSAQRAPSIAFFPDGRTLLASGESPESSRVLDLATGRVAYAIKNGGAREQSRARCGEHVCRRSLGAARVEPRGAFAPHRRCGGIVAEARRDLRPLSVDPPRRDFTRRFVDRVLQRGEGRARHHRAPLSDSDGVS